MTNRLPLAPAIQWYEGMLLSPQHFQQLDLRWQQILGYHLDHLSPYHWGIITLAFDPVTLPTGIIRILELKAIMPDGLVVEYIAKPNTPQLEIDVSNQREAFTHASLQVYLCVPEYIKGSSPVIGEWPRYYSMEGEEVLDDNVIDNVVQIPRLLPKLSLHVGHQPPARYHSFPIAKVGLHDDNFALKHFMPPCFHTDQLSLLGEKCGQLVSKIREKASYLSEKWQALIGTPLLGEASVQLRPLVHGLPILEPLVLSGMAHPYEMYRSLCELAGNLSTLRLGQIPPVFPIYNHDDILGSTQPLLDWCQAIIDSIERAYSLLLFVQHERTFSLMLHSKIFTKRLLIGIKAPPTMSEGELEDWMNDSIIASESMYESALIRRITGAPRKVITKSELYDLLPGRGVLIFSVPTEHHFIKPNEKLIVCNPADTDEKRPTEVLLYLRHSEVSGDIIDHIEEEE